MRNPFGLSNIYGKALWVSLLYMFLPGGAIAFTWYVLVTTGTTGWAAGIYDTLLWLGLQLQCLLIVINRSIIAACLRCSITIIRDLRRCSNANLLV